MKETLYAVVLKDYYGVPFFAHGPDNTVAIYRQRDHAVKFKRELAEHKMPATIMRVKLTKVANPKDT